MRAMKKPLTVLVLWNQVIEDVYEKIKEATMDDYIVPYRMLSQVEDNLLMEIMAGSLETDLQ